MTPTQAQVQAIAEVVYRIKAPRYGNDVRPFEELGLWERKEYLDTVTVVIANWEEVRPDESVTLVISEATGG